MELPAGYSTTGCQLDFLSGLRLSFPIMRRILPGIIVLSLLYWFPTSGCQRTGATEGLAVKFVASGNVGGEIEPCG